MQIFEDRVHAGKLLAKEVKKYIKEHHLPKKDIVIFSLLRGGFVLGKIIAESLGLKHYPMVVAKIGAPGNPEVAWGALAIDVEVLNPIIDTKLRQVLPQEEYNFLFKQEKNKALRKIYNYLTKFNLDIEKLKKAPKNKICIIVDDGVATGASAYAAAKFLEQNGAKKIILAVPVAPANFVCRPYFDDCIILIKDPNFMAVGQYYKDFSEVQL